MSPTRSGAVARVGLVLAGIILALGIAEGLARFATRDATGLGQALPPFGMYTADDDGLKVPVPGYHGWAVLPGQRVEMVIDSMGLRGTPQATGQPGWLLIGDSFTLGAQVPEAATFRTQLEQALGAPVWNAGVDNYSTWEATRRYLALADRLPVRGVLLTVCIDNDMHDNQGWFERAQQGAPPLPVVGFEDRPGPVTLFLHQHSILRALVASRLQLRSRQARPGPQGRAPMSQRVIYSQQGQEMLRQLMPATRSAFEELRQAVADHGHQLLVGFAPEAIQVDPRALEATFAFEGLDLALADVEAPNRAYAGALGELGVASCDPTQALREAVQRGERPYLTWDGHWSAAGHALYAQAILACMGI